MDEANSISVPSEVDIIAKTISPPMNCTGMKAEKISAPKPILDPASNSMG